MANIDKAFDVGKEGITLNDIVGIFTNTTDPSVVGETAPIGSLLLRTNGDVYSKIGAGDTDWTLIGSTSIGMNDLTDADTVTVAPTNGDSLVWISPNWVPSSAAQAGGNYGNGYAFSYDTTTQPIAVINTWQNVTFSTNIILNGWTHTAGTADFVAAATSLYLVTYEFCTQKNGGGNVQMITRATVNNVEVNMSHNGMDLTSNNTTFAVSRTFPVLITAGQTLRLQINGGNTTGRIIPAPAGVPAVASPVSGSMTIRRMT